jgi:hypothetical protein
LGVAVVVVLSVLYHALVLEQRVGGWAMCSVPAEESAS